MKDLNKNEIDEIFRGGLSESDIAFDEAHWRDMKKKLANDNNRRRDIILWTSMGGAAAMLIMAFAWWFVAPSEIKEVKLVKSEPVHTTPKAQPQPPAVAESPVSISTMPQAGNRKAIEESSLVSSSLNYSQTIPAFNNSIAQSTEGPNQQPLSVGGQQIVSNAPTAAPQVSANLPPQDQPSAVSANSGQMIASQQANVVKEDSVRITTKNAAKFKPQLVLSIVASPDFDAVRSFSDTRMGFNGGILATVSVSKKFSITTGAVLAQKRYETPFSNYSPSGGYVFAVAPLDVYAECRVLDIPLNLNYTFLEKPKYKLGITAGASSYLMLTEAYDFTYQNHYVKWPKNYKVRGENNHFMGIANMSVSYERKLNENIGIGLRPYVQLPITGVGYGNVKLLSAGASMSLNVNISKITGKK